ncbi:MAG: OB-fold nucleic acid binding domain-containing protein [Candidatus Odinarchaeum yellowstonii]|uniref:OB-fold nucleic acid binding domain-containing protein n=1 Tax=Odinarchaeota yellowstonii (strain LCB_4) TaxID=1841599 RepID=A0AAF0D3D1_ODILC|nr:MAG: OB-fold nucleic acid binding domain-containing protein [Candidatus Odinarchaeum yellowstonii]
MSLSIDEVIHKIRAKVKISKEDLLNKIRLKKNELGGLITDEGAAYIIAKELGVNIFEDQNKIEHKLKISDLIPGMSSVSITGVVKDLTPVKVFDRGGGRKGAVASGRLMDNSGEIRVVFWDEKTTSIKQGIIRDGRVIKIIRGYVKEGRDGKPELNVGVRSEILYPTDTGLEHLYSKPSIITDFSELEPGKTGLSVAGIVTRIFAPSTFTRADGSEGQVMSFILQGVKGSCRVVIWGDGVSLFDGLKEGETIYIKNLSARENRNGEIELHATSTVEVEVNPDLKFDFSSIPETRLLQISEINGRYFDIDVAGKVTSIFEEKEFSRADGSIGRVKSIIISDNTGSARVSFWDDKIDEISSLKIGDILKISHAYTKVDDFGVSINTGATSIIEINPSDVTIPSVSESVKRKIVEINADSFNISVTGKVIQIYDLKEFNRTDGSTGKVLSMIIADETASIRAVAWGKSAEFLKDLKIGDIIQVKGGYAKTGLNNNVELHLGDSSTISINPLGVELSSVNVDKSVSVSTVFQRKKISELQPQDKVEVTGTIVYVLGKNIVYPACPSCFKKASKTDTGWVCDNCGGISEVKYRIILSVTIDDGTGTIRANLLGNSAETILGASAAEIQNLIEEGREVEVNALTQSLIAKTYVFGGKVIFSDFSQDNELNVTYIRPVEPEKEAKNLLEYLNSGE